MLQKRITGTSTCLVAAKLARLDLDEFTLQIVSSGHYRDLLALRIAMAYFERKSSL